MSHFNTVIIIINYKKICLKQEVQVQSIFLSVASLAYCSINYDCQIKPQDDHFFDLVLAGKTQRLKLLSLAQYTDT